MQQQHELNGDIEQFLQRLQGEESAEHEKESPQDEPPQPATEQGADEEIPETIHVYFVREPAAPQQDEQVIESTPPTSPQRKSDLPAYTTTLFFLLLILSCLAFQLSLVFNPPTVTITVVPKSQVVSLTGTVQLGRAVSPITLSQSQTVPTTGKGHQNPRAATGFITLFNGQLTSIIVPAGTVITSASGVAIVTNQDAAIPPADPTANPPVFGRVTVLAHATNVGTAGNIAAYAINQPCCRASVIAKNMTPFTGGQDKRNFHTVSTADIGITATTLKTTLTESMQGALEGQLRQGETLQTLPCTPTTTADHHIGQEAASVKVTVLETCSAVSYHTDALVSKATDLLSHQATQQPGTGYSLIGTVQVRITQATVTHTTAILKFSCQGTWVYALSQEAQQQMKHLIAGKPRREAITLLLAMPGIETATVEGDDQTPLPKSLDALHLSIIVPTT
jgi:hypothetical protein